MRRLTEDFRAAYLVEDSMGAQLDAVSRDFDNRLTSQRWLRETPAKRVCFEELYGDLLKSAGLSICDVGGGLSALTRVLSRSHSYHLVDPLVHDSDELIAMYIESDLSMRLSRTGWTDLPWRETYDVVVANDLFPNVDQRLDSFLATALPVSKVVRLSLTFYESERVYHVKRVGADETMWILAWDGDRTRGVLERHQDRIIEPDWTVFDPGAPSLFPNGRQVVTLEMKGDLYHDG